MYYNIKNYIYIKNIVAEIRETIETCTTWARVKIHNYKNNKRNKIAANKKFERISTDIYGPFNIRDFKNDCVKEMGHILSITDIYTRYTRLYFFERITSNDVIQSLESWIAEFCPPSYVISDNGKQYDNKNMSEFLKTEMIEQILVPEYTPSSNGISERLNKTISFTLTINKGKPIRELVSRTEKVINMNYNRSIGTSPAALCTGNDFYYILRTYKERTSKQKQETFLINHKVGDWVYKRVFNANKLELQYEPFSRQILEIGQKGFGLNYQTTMDGRMSRT